MYFCLSTASYDNLKQSIFPSYLGMNSDNFEIRLFGITTKVPGLNSNHICRFILFSGMSYSGESDTESTSETNIQSYKCNLCQFKPDFNTLVYMLEQIVLNGGLLVRLPNGQYFVRCEFEDCCRYFHLTCIHPTFPDESLNSSHF